MFYIRWNILNGTRVVLEIKKIEELFIRWKIYSNNFFGETSIWKISIYFFKKHWHYLFINI